MTLIEALQLTGLIALMPAHLAVAFWVIGKTLK